MGHPTTPFTLGIPFASSDGRYYSRYPQGDRFGVAGNASGALATAVTSASAGTAANVTNQAEADWLSRALGAGVKYATNFDDVVINGVLQPSRKIDNKAELLAEALDYSSGAFSSRPAGEQAEDHIAWDTTRKLTGRASLQFITMPGDGANGGSWRINPSGTPGAAPIRSFYCQFSVYYPKETLGYRWRLQGDAGPSSAAMKVINFGQAGGGQIVIYNPRFLGFPSAFINQSGGNIASAAGYDIGTPNPWSTSCPHIHNKVDSGATVTTKAEYLTRYGCLPRGLDGDMDLSYNPAAYLYQRAQPSGFPDTRASFAGFPFQLDNWTTLEAYCEFNEATPDESTWELWGARYGQPPKFLFSGRGNIPLFNSPDNAWDSIELLNYDTQRISEPGVRPNLFTNYDELIISTNEIPFPGGYSLPRNNSALASIASQLVAGGSSLGLGDTGLNATNTETGWAVNWHDRHFYDATRRKFRFVGKKQASLGGQARHIEYDEATNAWTASGQLWGDELGHMYSSVAFDEVAGDLYTNTLQTGDRVRKWVQGTSLDTWAFATSDGATPLDSIDYSSQNKFVSGEGGCAWHPNLFGAGSGGLIVICQRGVAAWRKSTDTWQILSGLYTAVGDAPTCTYIAGLGAVILTNGSTLKAWRITQGPTVAAINDTPVHVGPVSWTSGTNNVGGLLIDDPQKRNTCYILEKTQDTSSTLTRRVWKYNAGAWDLQTYGHPFFSSQTGGEDWSGCAVYGYGVIHALERVSNSLRSRIWKPNS